MYGLLVRLEIRLEGMALAQEEVLAVRGKYARLEYKENMPVILDLTFYI